MAASGGSRASLFRSCGLTDGVDLIPDRVQSLLPGFRLGLRSPFFLPRPPPLASSPASLLNHMISILLLSASKPTSSLSARSRRSSTLLSFPLPPNRDTSNRTGANLLASPPVISARRPSFDSSPLHVAASPALLVHSTAHFAPPSPTLSRLLCLALCIRGGFPDVSNK